VWTIFISKHSELHIFLFYHNKDQRSTKLGKNTHVTRAYSKTVIIPCAYFSILFQIYVTKTILLNMDNPFVFHSSLYIPKQVNVFVAPILGLTNVTIQGEVKCY